MNSSHFQYAVSKASGLPKYIGKDTSKVQMLGDNQGAIALTKNPHLHKGLKHVNIY
jgi:hypothetical protein